MKLMPEKIFPNDNSFAVFMSVVGEENYYFGIGGIGDFLLLLSTFYDDVEEIVNVVFVANNVIPIKNLSNFFPLIRLFLYDRTAFIANKETWEVIKNNKQCLGTGATPKDFNYIGDWNDCGKTDVFKYYGVKRVCDWATTEIISLNPVVVLQPFGGSEDRTKVKSLSFKEIDSICKKYNGKHMLVIGTRGEIESFNGVLAKNDSDKNFISVSSDIRQAFELILSCHEFIGVDSWGKTLAALGGKKHITVYANLYTTDPMQLFGQEIDPGDYVFLRNWGFNFSERTL